MDVLLVNSPMSWDDHKVVNANPPTGLLYLTSYLRKSSALDGDVEVFDPAIEGLGVNQTVSTIRNREFDVFGINMTTSLVEVSSEVVARVDSDNVLTVVGGIHPSLDAEDALEQSGADVAVRNEGEVTFEELLAHYQTGKQFDDIPGITYRDEGGIRHNEDRSFISNLDVIPFPALDEIELEKYSEDRTKGYIVSSRGCPHACIFCSTPTFLVGSGDHGRPRMWPTKSSGTSRSLALKSFTF